MPRLCAYLSNLPEDSAPRIAFDRQPGRLAESVNAIDSKATSLLTQYCAN